MRSLARVSLLLHSVNGVTAQNDLAAKVVVKDNRYEEIYAAYARTIVRERNIDTETLAQIFVKHHMDAKSVLDAAPNRNVLEKAASSEKDAVRERLSDALNTIDVMQPLGEGKESRLGPYGMALLGFLILVGGVEVESGDASITVPGLLETLGKIPQGLKDDITDLLLPPTEPDNSPVEGGDATPQAGLLEATSIEPPGAPFVSRADIPSAGIPFDEARGLSQEISERFRRGDIELPDLPPGTKSYKVDVVKPWTPDGESFVDRYLLGAGVSYASTSNSECFFRAAVTVFVPFPSLEKGRPLVKLRALKEQFGRFGVQVDYGGTVKPLSMTRARLRRSFERLPIGCSVLHPNQRVGSITCFVRVKESADHHFVTSWHVATNFGKTGADTMLQRPVGSNNADIATVTGSLYALSPDGGLMDAALVRLHPETLHDRNRAANGTLVFSQVRAMDRNELQGAGVSLEKVGCGTGVTVARARKLLQEAYVAGPDESVYVLHDQIEVGTERSIASFAKAGDSGAPVWVRSADIGDRFLIGQVACGNELGGKEGVTYVTPIEPLLSHFNAELVDP